MTSVDARWLEMTNVSGFFFAAGPKKGESWVKTKICHGLSKFGLLCSIYILLQGTIKRKAIRTPNARHDQVDNVTHFSVTQNVPYFEILNPTHIIF